jgi:hypothetical protein
MSSAENNFLRLKKLLLNDKSVPQGLMDVLTADIDAALQGYFDFENKNLSVLAVLGGDGKYEIKINLVADRLKNIKFL